MTLAVLVGVVALPVVIILGFLAWLIISLHLGLQSLDHRKKNGGRM